VKPHAQIIRRRRWLAAPRPKIGRVLFIMVYEITKMIARWGFVVIFINACCYIILCHGCKLFDESAERINNGGEQVFLCMI